jgi:hypothetical protein
LRGAAQLRGVFGLRVPAVVLAALVWWWMGRAPTWKTPVLPALLAGLSIYVLPAAFTQYRTYANAAEIEEFRDWSIVIPPSSTVLVAPARDVGAFVWFTLERPNYLAVDQSAGVVFSRATSIEIKRRSGVLLPLMDPNWKILTNLRVASAVEKRNAEAASRRLTAKSLAQVCADPLLGFVISPEALGFKHLRHDHAGAWKEWNLYDCRLVRSALAGT